MLYRSWLFIAAFGLIAGLGQAQAQTYSTDGQRNPQEEPAQSLPIPLPVKIIENEDAVKIKEYRDEKSLRTADADLLAQQSMNVAAQEMNQATQRMAKYAYWSTISVGIGTVLLIITLALTYSANRSALAAIRVTEDIGKRQLRAYVTVGIDRGVLLGAERRQLRIHIQFKNAGQTPAKSVRSVTASGVMPYRPPLGCITSVPDLREGEGSHSTMATGDTLTVNKVVDMPHRKDLDEMVARNHMIHVWGSVFYDDIFDAPWRTNFFFWIRNPHLIEAVDRPIPEDGLAISVDGSAFTRSNQWNEIT